MSAPPELDGPASWRRLAATLALSSLGGVGLWSSVVILPEIQAEFGIDRSGASFPYAATMVAFAVGGIGMGRLSDRYGIVPPLIFGITMLALGYIATALAPNYETFVLAQALLIGMLGSSVTFAPLVADCSLWFRKRRGLAVAIAASGNYVAGAAWPPVITASIAEMGWRDTHFWIGIVCFVTMIPLVFLLRARAPDNASETKAAESAQIRSGLPPGVLQLMLIVAGIACCVAMAMPQVHMVAYCVDLGYGAARGAEMLSVMLACGVVSRLASGAIADRFGGVATIIIGSIGQCIVLVLYLPFDSLVSLYTLAAIFGLSQGGIVPSYAIVVREYFPAKEAGRRVSLVLMMTVLGMAIGGWLSGEIYDRTGSYQAAFANGIAWNLLNLAIAFRLLIGQRRWRRVSA